MSSRPRTLGLSWICFWASASLAGAGDSSSSASESVIQSTQKSQDKSRSRGTGGSRTVNPPARQETPVRTPPARTPPPDRTPPARTPPPDRTPPPTRTPPSTTTKIERPPASVESARSSRTDRSRNLETPADSRDRASTDRSRSTAPSRSIDRSSVERGDRSVERNFGSDRNTDTGKPTPLPRPDRVETGADRVERTNPSSSSIRYGDQDRSESSNRDRRSSDRERGDARTVVPSPVVPGTDRGAPTVDDLRRRLEIDGRPNSGVTPEAIRQRFRDRDTAGRPVADRIDNPGLDRSDSRNTDARNRSDREVRKLPIRGSVDAHDRLPGSNPGLRKLPRANQRIQPDAIDPAKNVSRFEGDSWFRAEDYNRHHYAEDYGHYDYYDYRDRCYQPYHSNYFDFHLVHPSWCVSFGLHYGYDFGYVFCRDDFGYVTNMFWYYRYPGFRACYVPYSCYYRPSCGYYPAYSPNYSTVYYVRERIVEADIVPELPSSEIIDPNLDNSGLLDLGWRMFSNGDYAGAAEAFRQATLKDPDDPWAKLAFAQGLFAIGNYPDAAFLLRRGMELLPDWPNRLRPPAEFYGNPADHREQLLALGTFLEFVPGDPSALLLQSVQQTMLGDLDAAREGFEQLRTLDPTDQVALRFLESIGARGR